MAPTDLGGTTIATITITIANGSVRRAGDPDLIRGSGQRGHVITRAPVGARREAVPRPTVVFCPYSLTH
jgi:hypothetical protein